MTSTENAGVGEGLVDWEDMLSEVAEIKKEPDFHGKWMNQCSAPTRNPGDVLSEAAEIKKELPDFHRKWMDQCSAPISNPGLVAAEALRKLYPKHSIVSTLDFRLDPLTFPGAQLIPLEHNPLITTVGFAPLNRASSPVPGVLVDRVVCGGFTMNWQEKEFLLFIVQYPSGFGLATHNFVLHKGSEQPSRQLLLECGVWAESVHNEIWVFNQGFWQKDGGLWNSIQKASWNDVILKDKFKKDFQKDVYGFFESEELYKELGIPWKRGIIMHGPPGNGKTISLKAVMKTCDAIGYTALYVKSFQSFGGDEYSMRLVFNKARQLAPCVLFLEDLDSLITDRNRSFFLNELDGLEGNDGILLLATTNHFDRLDPGLSTRPSRFDRKFLFDDPDREERALYVVYWQKKLKNNKSIDFPDTLVDEVAGETEAFSFAYLKEAFVSSLVILAGMDDDEEDKPSFRTVVMDQIAVLRKQLDKPLKDEAKPSTSIEENTQTVTSPVSVPLSPTSRPLPQPWRSSEQHIRFRPALRNDPSKYFTAPGYDRDPAAQSRNSLDALKVRRAYANAANAANALRVPGGFGEDDLFSQVPPLPGSAKDFLANDTLPGISGSWTSN